MGAFASHAIDMLGRSGEGVGDGALRSAKDISADPLGGSTPLPARTGTLLLLDSEAAKPMAATTDPRRPPLAISLAAAPQGMGLDAGEGGSAAAGTDAAVLPADAAPPPPAAAAAAPTAARACASDMRGLCRRLVRGEGGPLPLPLPRRCTTPPAASAAIG
jgi:hypothetical protein